MSCNNNSTPLMRGTTPTITMTYKTVDVSSIAEAWLTIKQSASGTTINKELSTATVGEKSLSWTLTQKETLQIKTNGNVQIQCRYLLQDGTAGGSAIYNVSPYAILREGEIT